MRTSKRNEKATTKLQNDYAMRNVATNATIMIIYANNYANEDSLISLLSSLQSRSTDDLPSE